jgi:RNA polymerase sigma-70 factor (ECF subfamily)
MIDETAVISACLRGAEEEYRAVVDHYKAPLMAAAVNILGNREDAEDVCQETFIRAYRNLAAFDPGRSFKNWIFSILYHGCLDVLRKRRRFRAAETRLKSEFPRRAAGRASREPAPGPDRGIGETILARLTAKERTAVVLWASEGFTSAEIAGVMGCSASTARVTLFNARKKLKTFLEKNHGSF